MDELLTVEEVASYLRVSRSTVYRLVVRKELPAYKIAHRWMFDRDDLKAFIAHKRIDVEQAEENQAHVKHSQGGLLPADASFTGNERG